MMCSCGHRLGIHQYPYACKGGVSYPDEMVGCDCFHYYEYEVIAQDRAALAEENA